MSLMHFVHMPSPPSPRTTGLWEDFCHTSDRSAFLWWYNAVYRNITELHGIVCTIETKPNQTKCGEIKVLVPPASVISYHKYTLPRSRR